MRRLHRGKIPITLQLAMNREQKLLHNQQVRRSGLLVARFLRDVARLPQALIDLILRDLRNTLRVTPLRNLHLLLPDLQMFALNPLFTESPHRSYYDRFGGSSGFSSLDPNLYPRRTDWAHPTRFDELVTGRRYLDNREDPPNRIVQGESGLGTYGSRLGYGSFQ